MVGVDNSARKDPISEVPLREPGQSLRESIQARSLDAVIPWIAVAALGFMIALLEWFRSTTNTPYMPWTMTALAVAMALIAAWRIHSNIAELPRWKLGLKGERAVGQYLQATLLTRGYFVLHDICFDGFNIDHVAIGPGGVYAIEVKTCSKRKRGNAMISYDGHRVLVDGRAPDRDPVTQARAAARSLRETLEKYTGQRVPIRPVVLFPGWFVERQPSGADTWVLNEKAFVKFVEREPSSLSADKYLVLKEGLARYVRDQFES